MDSDMGFRAVAPDKVAVGFENGEKRATFAVPVDRYESQLYEQLAASTASLENSTEFLDAFYAAASHTDLDWSIEVGDEPHLVADEEIEMQSGTAYLLDLLFEERSEWDSASARLEDSKGVKLLEPEYEGPRPEDIEDKELHEADFDGYGVKHLENGNWVPAMKVRNGEDGFYFPVRQDTSGIVSESFLEDRRRKLEEGEYSESFRPDPAAVYEESLGREFRVPDAEPFDALSTMVYFIENSGEDPDVYLDEVGEGEERTNYSVLSYGDESFRAPTSLWISHIPVSDSVQMAHDAELFESTDDARRRVAFQ